MFNQGRPNLLRCNEDDIALRIAAERNRLAFDRPTEHEMSLFPELWNSKSGVQVFLFIRNTALHLWMEDPTEELSICDLRNSIQPPFNSDPRLIENIHHYLTRNGLINVGRFKRATGIPRVLPEKERRVVVIGAGMSGISAALQLISFGFDVTIIEARNYIGGRISSIGEGDQMMEIGADMLTNAKTNPLSILIQQLNVEPHAVNEKMTIYDKYKSNDPQRDRLVYGMYSSIRDSLDVVSHKKERRDENGRFISRQQGYENVLNIIERDTILDYYNFWQGMLTMCKKRENHYNEVKNCRDIVNLCEKRLTELEKNGVDADPMLRRSLRKDINRALEKFDNESEELDKCDVLLANYKKYPASKQFMHPSDFHNFNYYLAQEEFIFGAPLEKVQFSCEAVKNRSSGSTLRFHEGISGIIEKLVEERNLDIRFNRKLIDLNYTDDEVLLKVKNTETDEIEEMKANFCVCTIPIGVLKKSIVNDERAPTFTPPLPEVKVDAIRNMGNGLINKVVMLFDRPFWETGERYYFGIRTDSIKSRGEMFFWSTVPGSRVLTTYLSGFSADVSLPEEVIITKAMTLLSNVFAQTCPKMPVQYHITRYQDDELAFGSGSFMSLRTELKHYDYLMEPLTSTNDKRNVYFAGEHTSACYSGSLQGAWLSGIRVAAEMANNIYGLSYVNFGDDVELLDGEMSVTPQDEVKGKEVETVSINGDSNHLVSDL